MVYVAITSEWTSSTCDSCRGSPPSISLADYPQMQCAGPTRSSMIIRDTLSDRVVHAYLNKWMNARCQTTWLDDKTILRVKKCFEKLKAFALHLEQSKHLHSCCEYIWSRPKSAKFTYHLTTYFCENWTFTIEKAFHSFIF